MAKSGPRASSKRFISHLLVLSASGQPLLKSDVALHTGNLARPITRYFTGIWRRRRMAFDVYFVGLIWEQLRLTPNFLTIWLLSRLNGV